MAGSPEYVSVNHTEQPYDGPKQTTRWRPWQPGFFRRLPWAGVACMILALGCGITAICLALAIDGKPLNYWTVNGYVVQPAVLLSIVATIANAFLVFAFTKGATISWYVVPLHQSLACHAERLAGGTAQSAERP